MYDGSLVQRHRIFTHTGSQRSKLGYLISNNTKNYTTGYSTVYIVITYQRTIKLITLFIQK